MKKRIYFLISAAVQIVAFIYSMLAAKQLVESLLETVSLYPEEIRNRVVELYSNSGTTFIIILAAIGIILNFLIIYYAMNDRLLKKKGVIITCSVFAFLFGEYEIIQLFAVINIIVMALSKRENSKDYPEDIKKMPILMKEKSDKKKTTFSVVLVACYFSQFVWGGFIPDSKIIKGIVQIVFYVGMIVLSIIAFKDLYRDNFRVFRDNFKTYMSYLFKKIGIFYLIYFGVAIITVFLAKEGVSVNQSNVESLPLYVSLPLAIIYAPIVEEAIFRGSIRRFIKNDKLFIVTSGLTFGLLHTIFTELTIYNAIVMAIPYVTIGFFLAYLYKDTNNIFTNMTFHALQNTFAMIITILIKGLFLMI